MRRGVERLEHAGGLLESVAGLAEITRFTADSAYNRDDQFDESKRLVAGAPVYSPFVRHNPDAIR